SVRSPLHCIRRPPLCPPRRSSDLGLTLTRDQGFSPFQVDDLMGAYGEFIDYTKIKQFELFYQPAEMTRRKVANYRKHAVKVFTGDRKSTRLNSSHVKSSYAVFCLK